MSNAPQFQRKVKPQSSSGGLPPEAIIGGVLFAAILLAIALAAAFAARGDEDGETLVPPTAIPMPTYAANGETLAAGDILTAPTSLKFSIAAMPGQENEEIITGDCAALEVIPQPGTIDVVSVDEEGAYWVYAAVVDNPALNGWLPLASLTPERPEECPALAEATQEATEEATPEN